MLTTENYYLRDNLLTSFITPVLLNMENRNKIQEFISDFLSRHEAQLSTKAPVYTFIFGDNEIAPLYNLVNLSSERLQEIIKGDEKLQPFRISPDEILITAFIIDAIQNNYTDILRHCLVMMGCMEYPAIYKKFWVNGIIEDAMNATVEQMSDQFKVKRMDTLLELLEEDIHTCMIFLNNQLSDGNDTAYITFIIRVHNQIKNTMKNIANKYYKVYESQFFA